jgi:hypothetical protein
MEDLETFFSEIGDSFSWDSFVQSPKLEESFQEVLEKDILGYEEPALPLQLNNRPPIADQKRHLDYRKRSELQQGNNEEQENRLPSKQPRKGKGKKLQSVRFAPAPTEDEMIELTTPFVPKNTQANNQWALRNFQDWVSNHTKSNPPETCSRDILKVCSNPAELSKWLCLYVTSTRKTDGTKYTPKTIQCLLAGLWRYIKEFNRHYKKLNFLDTENKEFKEFHTVLDRVFRQLCKEGIGCNPKSAPIITNEEEDLLWSRQVLGSHNPEALLRAVFYLNGKNFHLRGGQEHRFLCISQLQRLTNPDRYVYLCREWLKESLRGTWRYCKKQDCACICKSRSWRERSCLYLGYIFVPDS